jgi:hypothetical protein
MTLNAPLPQRPEAAASLSDILTLILVLTLHEMRKNPNGNETIRVILTPCAKIALLAHAEISVAVFVGFDTGRDF